MFLTFIPVGCTIVVALVLAVPISMIVIGMYCLFISVCYLLKCAECHISVTSAHSQACTVTVKAYMQS